MLPALGGAIGSLRRGAREVLRPTPAGADDPLATACFPLVPYANRIAHGRFVHDGAAVQLPLNFGAHPHSLHGIGWQRPWRVVQAEAAAATLAFAHDGGAGWPWRFTATQSFALDQDGLAATLTLRNDDTRPMPAGLGFHPYFPTDAESVLTFASRRMWQVDTDMLATAPDQRGLAAGWAAGAPVRPFVDNAFEDWTGRATLDEVRLTAEHAPWLHLYIPPEGGYCCVEPVSHGPDVINREGMPELAPGEAITLTMQIGLDEPAP